MGAMTAGAWLSWPSISIRVLEEGKRCCNVSKTEIGWMVALLDFGNMLTPIPASYFMDWVGRKPTLFSTAALYIGGSILVWVADNIWFLYAARLCFGLSKGIAFSVVPIYLAEMANVSIRGAMSTIFIGFLNTGTIYEFIIAAVMGEDAYDTANIANLVVPVIFCIGFFFAPESPYYLSMKQKESRAVKALSHLRQLKVDDPELKEEAALITVTVKEDMANKGRYIDLITSKPMRRATLIISMLALFQRGSGITPTLAYMTVTLPKHGGGFSREVYMIIFSTILVVANFLVSPLVDTWGRKKLMLLSTAINALMLFISGIFYFFRNKEYDVSSWLWLPYASLVGFGFSYSFGIGFIPSTLVGELFPTNVKCYASSVSAMILAGTSFVMNKLFREVSEVWGEEAMYLIFSLTQVGAAVFVLMFVFETKGRTFAEIQNILKQL